MINEDRYKVFHKDEPYVIQRKKFDTISPTLIIKSLINDEEREVFEMELKWENAINLESVERFTKDIFAKKEEDYQNELDQKSFLRRGDWVWHKGWRWKVIRINRLDMFCIESAIFKKIIVVNISTLWDSNFALLTGFIQERFAGTTELPEIIVDEPTGLYLKYEI